MDKQQYQGDISIIEIDPKFAEKLNFKPLRDKIVVAEGEVTGHKHILVAEPEAKIDIAQDLNGYYLRVNSGQAALTHEKHDVQTITPSQKIWFVGKQFEYDELQERAVRVSD